MRLYFGADAMATNGLRYGAAIELRENFTGQISSNTSTNASGYSSLSTVYVRRAFTYVAGENWGIVRFGMADGVIGIFDNGVTTGQFLINGFGGGDNQNVSGAGDSVLLPGHAGRRVRQHEARLSVAADRRLRLRPPVGAEHLERLRHQHRQPAERVDHRRRHRDRSWLRDGGKFRVSEPVVWSGHPGRIARHEPDRDWRPLPGHVRRPGRVGLCRL